MALPARRVRWRSSSPSVYKIRYSRDQGLPSPSAFCVGLCLPAGLIWIGHHTFLLRQLLSLGIDHILFEALHRGTSIVYQCVDDTRVFQDVIPRYL